jgi:hypothetical protein
MANRAFIIASNGENLKYAVSGAEKIASILRESGYIVMPESPETSIIKPKEIYEIFSEMTLDAEESDDVVIFYFSGHGVINKNDNTTLHLLLDSSEVNKLSTYVNFNVIASYLSASPYKNKLVVLDCCEATDTKFEDAKEGNYVFIRATRNYQTTEEIEDLKSSFLSYYLHLSFLSNCESPVFLSNLKENLYKAVDDYNQQYPLAKIPRIPISGREDSDFEIIPQKSKIKIFISYNYQEDLTRLFVKDISEIILQQGFNLLLRNDSEIEKLSNTTSYAPIVAKLREADIILFIIESKDINSFNKIVSDSLSAYRDSLSLFECELQFLQSNTISKKTIFLMQDDLLIDIEHGILFTHKSHRFSFEKNRYILKNFNGLKDDIQKVYSISQNNSLFFRIMSLSNDFDTLKNHLKLIGEDKFVEFIRQLKKCDDFIDDKEIIRIFCGNKLGNKLLQKTLEIMRFMQKDLDSFWDELNFCQSDFLYVYLIAIEDKFINRIENDFLKEFILLIKKGMEVEK